MVKEIDQNAPGDAIDNFIAEREKKVFHGSAVSRSRGVGTILCG